jgi:hypothetical protein
MQSHQRAGMRRHKLLRLLTAFAVGGLLGDVFIHILPHIATGHSHDSHHSDHSHIDIITGAKPIHSSHPPPHMCTHARKHDATPV